MNKQEYESNPQLYWENPLKVGAGLPTLSGQLLPLSENPLWVKNILPDILINLNHNLCVDLGCGGGRYIGHTAQYFKQVVGVDFSKSNIEQARNYVSAAGIENITFYCTSLNLMANISVGSVDFAYSAAVFMHMTNEVKKAALKELSRILNPGGCAVLLEITSMKDAAFDCPDITPKEWENMIVAAGLYIIKETKIEGGFVKYKICKGGKVK